MSKLPLSDKQSHPFIVLTPLHIGSGQKWEQTFDFIYEDGWVRVLNRQKLFEALDEVQGPGQMSGLDFYIKSLETRREEPFLKLLNDHVDLDSVTFLEYQMQGGRPATAIASLLRNGLQEKPFVPGSSIKGAMRSAMLHYLHHRPGGGEVFDKNIDNTLLGSFERSILRYVRPYDVGLSETALYNIRLFNLRLAGFDWESGFKGDNLTTLEVFTPRKAAGSLSLAVDNGFMELVKSKYPEILHRHTQILVKEKDPAQFLFSIINAATQTHIKREIEFFERYDQAEDTVSVINHLQYLLQVSESLTQGCVLRMAWGSGFHNMTGDAQFRDHRETGFWDRGRDQGKKKYKSRRLAADNQLQPMGFVLIGAEMPDIPVPKNVRASQTITVSSNAPKAPVQLTATNRTDIDYAALGSNTAITAEVVQVIKPFSKVRLHLSNYPFDPVVDMSGTKGVSLSVGQVVKVFVNSRSQEGAIRTVTLIKSA